MYSDREQVDLVKDYSPSQWSKKFPDPKECINHHIDFVTNESKVNRLKYPKSKLNLSYGSTQRQSYDIFFKDNERTSKIFVYVHGGCWQMLDKEISAYCVNTLVEAGYRVIIVDYNLCPTVSLKKITDEMKTCMIHILQYAKETGAGEISVCGHSAGAHLLAMLLEEDFEGQTLIKNYFLISGIYDLREIWKNQAMDGDGQLKLDEKNVESLSPILFKEFCKKHKPSIHILFGENDSPSFKGQSIAFGKIVENSGFNAIVNEFPKYDHFEIVEELSNKDSLISKYIFMYF